MKIRLFRNIFLGLILLPLITSHIQANPQSNVSPLRDVYLTTPNLSDENISRYKVGIRPYRKSGIRIESQNLDSKLIVHNYGYGGSGLTLSWGGASEVVSLLNHEKDVISYYATVKKVAILGAGVIGLSTAHELLDRGYEVTLYANEFSPNLTSNIAGGIWSPPAILDHFSTEKKSMYERMLKISTIRFMASLDSSNPEFDGITTIKGYSHRVLQNGEKVLNTLFQATSTDNEIVNVHFDNGVIKECKIFDSLAIDGKIFMDQLFAKVIAKGGKVVEKQFNSLADINALEEEIVVNCTSLGSRELFGDQEMKGARGQMIDFKPQKGVDFMFCQNVPNSNYWITIHPWEDRIILGGNFEDGEEECIVDQSVIDTILKNGRDCLIN